MAEAYIVAAARTAGGKRGGKLKDWHPVDLGARLVDALVERSGADPAQIEDVIFGCVDQVGEQAVNVARNVVLASSLPESVPGTSIDRQCGSSQQALHFAAQAVMSGTMDIVIAGGVEHMTRVPMMLGASLPKKEGFGSYMSPNIRKRYPNVAEFSQFVGAEMIAEKYKLSKDVLDQFALESHRRAIKATEAGAFNDEIVPLEVSVDGKAGVHRTDEGIRFDASLESIRNVKLLREDGRLSAASASQICDGASGVVVVNDKGLKSLGSKAKPLARIHHMSVLGEDPVIMLEAPINATRHALRKAGMKLSDIDLFEVNEAFASVPLAWLQQLDADPARLNVNGGAIALGHPLGATGTKLMSTLVYALRARGKRYGLQTMCEGGGMANVTIVERL
jgi:acetyl-CoA C-acetyltransferase